MSAFLRSRVSESLQLTWAAYDGKRLTFISTNTKTKKTRGVLVADRLRKGSMPTGRHGLNRMAASQGSDLIFPAVATNTTVGQLICDSGPSSKQRVCHQHESPFVREITRNDDGSGSKSADGAKFTGLKLAQLQRYVDVSESDEMAALALLGAG